jgi:protein-tyrosine phosphatase
MTSTFSINSPLRIDHVEVPSGGLVGLTSCPGRNGLDGGGRQWQRNLAADLSAIEAWGPAVVVTLIETAEFAKFGIADLPAAVTGHRFSWHHVPIPDMQLPNAVTLQAWRVAEPEVGAALMRGQRVLFHCAAGLGRTGTMAAKLLVDFGMPARQAVDLVRLRRPGAIETAAQEAFVIDGRRLLETK